MNQNNIPYLALFIFSVLFLPIFAGLYTIYTIYYLPYFDTAYEYYFFSDKPTPTKLELLFSGFQNGHTLLHSLLLGFILTVLAKKLNTFIYTKKGIKQILYTSFIWTTYFAALFLLSGFLWYITVAHFSISFALDVIRAQLPFAIALYFIFVFPMVAILYRTYKPPPIQNT